jgi:ABC-type hemin transport system ATPase subunit
LAEQVVDIGIVTTGAGDDGDLGGQRMGTADAVDLAGISAVHGGQQQTVALGRVGRQVGSVKERRLSAARIHTQGSACKPL